MLNFPSHPDLKRIIVLNPKGGSGKSTLATNLAGFLSVKGFPAALMDFDPQGSSCEWLEARPAGRAPVKLLRAWQGETRSPRNAELVVMDVPAAGIWTAIILVLAIMQLPPTLVLLPIAIWVFSVAEPVPATREAARYRTQW